MAIGKRNDASRDFNKSEFQNALGYALITHTEPSGTDGGDFVQGAWRTRPLNTIDENYCEATLAANQFTLPAGRYVIWGTAIACAYSGSIFRHQTRIYDITNATAIVPPGTITILGTAAQGYACSHSIVEVRVRFTAATTFELQHRCQVTQAINGMGIDSQWGDNVYAIVEIWKVGEIA